MLFPWLTPTVRKWIYGLAAPTLGLLIGYGIIDQAQAALWAALVGAVLVPGMAALHTDSGYGRHAKPDEPA